MGDKKEIYRITEKGTKLLYDINDKNGIWLNRTNIL